MTALPPAAPAGHPAYRRHPRQTRRGVLGPVIGLVLLAFLGLVTFALLTLAYGVVGVALSTFLVLLVFPFVVAAFLWLDRWEPEPPALLLLAFAWGAFFATFFAGIGNEVGGYAVCPADDIGCVAVFVAPVVEESLKGLFLVGLVVLRRREIDGVLDGIVYAGLVGAGFALVEDVQYLAGSYEEAGGGGLAVLFVLRGLLSPFAHSLFTMMTGIGLALAVNARGWPTRILAPVAGFALAVALHAGWNFSAGLGEGFIAVYGLIMVPLFVVAVVLAVLARRREQRVIAAQLPAMVAAGWIVPSEVALLQSLAGRRKWRRHVRSAAGGAAAKAVAAYQAAVTELAVLRHRMARGAVGPQARVWHDELVYDVQVARAEATQRPGALQAAWGGRPPPPGWAPPPPPGWATPAR